MITDNDLVKQCIHLAQEQGYIVSYVGTDFLLVTHDGHSRTKLTFEELLFQ